MFLPRLTVRGRKQVLMISNLCDSVEKISNDVIDILLCLFEIDIQNFVNHYRMRTRKYIQTSFAKSIRFYKRLQGYNKG